MFEIELIICMKIDLALNNLQELICHKNQTFVSVIKPLYLMYSHLLSKTFSLFRNQTSKTLLVVFTFNYLQDGIKYFLSFVKTTSLLRNEVGEYPSTESVYLSTFIFHCFVRLQEKITHQQLMYFYMLTRIIWIFFFF